MEQLTNSNWLLSRPEEEDNRSKLRLWVCYLRAEPVKYHSKSPVLGCESKPKADGCESSGVKTVLREYVKVKYQQ